LKFDQRQLKSLTKEVETKKNYALLTPREKEVSALLVKGFLNKEIAQQLGISKATIKVHKARVIEKMQVTSMQDLVKKYLEADLEKP
jgi:DNA-binding NarL/FixJ family response regulator